MGEIRQTREFENWYSNLKDRQARPGFRHESTGSAEVFLAT